MTTIGIVGAGLSGVLMGMQLRRAGIDDFTIYDRHADVGGTWYRNTYPGLHCDVPSHLYCYSFEPNPDWSMTYASRAEIQDYLRSCADKYDLPERTRFDTVVDTARYDGHGAWSLETTGGEVTTHRMVVAATGGLAEPRLPRIDGFDTFEGEWWHAGAWRDDVELAGRRVAVVGSAASAVQVVPAVAESAAEVFVYSRSPNWVMPRNNTRYTDDEKAALRSEDERRRVRRRHYRDSLLWFRAFKRHRAALATLRRIGIDHMRSAIVDPALIEALTPDYDPGCKRILVSDDYYPALARDHVHLVPEAVAALTPAGVVDTSGREVAVDVVIFCTGYSAGTKAGGRVALDVYGRDGRPLTAALAERTEAYRGMAIPGFPNWFTVCGINGVVSYASYFLTAELETEYIARWARRLIDDDLESIEADPSVTRHYNDAIQDELQQMSWTGNCTNFYTDRRGRVVSFFPGSVGRMRRELRTVADGDFTVVHRRPNRVATPGS